MSDVVIYHNPRCSKSRQALALVEEAGVKPSVVKYLDTPPSAEELDAILKKLGMEPQQLMRTGEDRYKELGLGTKTLSRAEAIKVMVENPVLIERPIVIKGDKAVVARPPERAQELLG
ncbi:Arsenate reductase [compost metagenome]